MKKYASLFFVMALSINCLSQTATPGQLKITIESFKCLNKSWDGFVEFDGHGNEVFINYGYRIYHPSSPGTARPGAGFTSIFGSSGNGRIKAGTANTIGGIDNGNEIAVNVVVLNEHVDADHLILFSPSVWEWDNGNNGNLNLFNQQLATDMSWLMAQPYPFANANINYNDPFEGRFIKTTDKYNSYWPITKYNFLKSLVNVQENRPVGMKAGTFNDELLALYNPTLLVLDTRALIAFYNHNKSARESTRADKPMILSGLIETVFTEETYNIATSNGSYSLKLRIEFTPDIQSQPPPPPPTPKYTKQPTLINTFPTQSPNTIKVNVAGKWVGTYSSGKGSPAFYAFQLNADGSMQVLEESGGAIASGNYTLTKFVITGSYTYKNGSAFSFTGTVANNSMSGTWGSGNNVKGGGTWVMNKN